MKVYIECVRHDGKRLYLVDCAGSACGFSWTRAHENRAIFPRESAARIIASLPKRADTGAPIIVEERGKQMKRIKYALDAGRLIVRDGKPLAALHGVGQYQPTELDQFARDVVTHANYFERLRAATRTLAGFLANEESDEARRLLEEIQDFDPYAHNRTGTLTC